MNCPIISKRRSPLLSVIIATLNSEKTIKRAIDSLLIQRQKDFEVIIVDGGSTDRTIQIVKSFGDNISRIISEKDSGVYEAYNKGILLSKGEWLYFLNSDDFLFSPNVFDELFPMLRMVKNKSDTIVCGGVKVGENRIFWSNLDKRIFFRNTIHHQGVFFPKEILQNNQYDQNFKIFADYKFNLNLYFQKVRLISYPIVICCWQPNGLSDTPSLVGFWEENKIRNQILGNQRAVIYNIFAFFRLLFKVIRKCI